MNLYEIGQLVDELEALFESTADDFENAESLQLEAFYKAIVDEFEKKCEGLAKWRANEMALVNAIDVEINSLKDRRDRISNRVAKIDELTRLTMARLNMKKVVTTTATFNRQLAGGRQALIIDDETALDDEFKRTYTETVTTIDKERIRVFLAAGKEVAGARFAPKKEILKVTR